MMKVYADTSGSNYLARQLNEVNVEGQKVNGPAHVLFGSLNGKEKITMAGKKEQPSGAALSVEQISKVDELVKKMEQIDTRFQSMLLQSGGILPLRYGSVIGRGPVQVVMAPMPLPTAADITSNDYLQIIDSQGEIVNVSIKKIKEQLTNVIQSIGDVAQSAAEAGKNIASKASKFPFELDEIMVGLSIKAEAGFIVVGVGGDVNLELKFVRAKGAGAGTKV